MYFSLMFLKYSHIKATWYSSCMSRYIVYRYMTCIPFFKLQSHFSQNNNFKTWGEHTEKSSLDNALKLGIYTQ